MKKIVGLAALVLGGCGGVSEDEFAEKYPEKYCALAFECSEEGGTSLFATEADCVTFLSLFSSLVPEGCEYDSDKGAACLDEIDAATCDAIATGDGVASCEQVYGGEDCDLTTSSTFSDSLTGSSTP
jgi:hypothetical protein